MTGISITHSNYTLVQRTNNNESIFCKQKQFFHTMLNPKDPRHISNNRRKLIYTLDQIFQLLDHRKSALDPTPRAELALDTVNLESQSNQHIL